MELELESQRLARAGQGAQGGVAIDGRCRGGAVQALGREGLQPGLGQPRGGAVRLPATLQVQLPAADADINGVEEPGTVGLLAHLGFELVDGQAVLVPGAGAGVAQFEPGLPSMAGVVAGLDIELA